MKKLILFDIDGTLIRSHGGGRQALGEALQDVFGTAGPVEDYPMGGKTDARIITDLLIAAGIPRDNIAPKLPEVYARMAEKGVIIFWEKGMDPCVGIPPLLTALQAMSHDVVLGLLTGNSSATAPLKLSAAGIMPTQFVVGAYGSDAMDRNQLPAIAMSRASELTGQPFNGNNTVIIGDTPADILCARAGKATAVAVATGWHSSTTLATYQPDHLLENMADTQAILSILTADSES
ncbi:MAG: HAD hydrolase-like protein [Chloroflexi bacterium]|nr:HAD hydrolase-like protein [Chloroflexota bacterium]